MCFVQEIVRPTTRYKTELMCRGFSLLIWIMIITAQSQVVLHHSHSQSFVSVSRVSAYFIPTCKRSSWAHPIFFGHMLAQRCRQRDNRSSQKTKKTKTKRASSTLCDAPDFLWFLCAKFRRCPWERITSQPCGGRDIGRHGPCQFTLWL